MPHERTYTDRAQDTGYRRSAQCTRHTLRVQECCTQATQERTQKEHRAQYAVVCSLQYARAQSMKEQRTIQIRALRRGTVWAMCTHTEYVSMHTHTHNTRHTHTTHTRAHTHTHTSCVSRLCSVWTIHDTPENTKHTRVTR